ncbi:amidase family protein, partial [Nocardia farcinica]|uniref:amidase family protein n=1 Tax=Nocardia farcinica TaxID=37329 RepID=UPI00226BC63D
QGVLPMVGMLVASDPVRSRAAGAECSATMSEADTVAEVDVLLTPVLSHPAPLIGDHSPNLPFDELFAKLVDYVGFTPLNNVGGGPAVSLPHGRMSANLPGSIQLSARRGAERTLLDLA